MIEWLIEDDNELYYAHITPDGYFFSTCLNVVIRFSSLKK